MLAHCSESLLTSISSPLPVYGSRGSRRPVVRGFVLHVLCMSNYESYRENLGVIKRVYRAWAGSESYLRMVSR